MANLTFPSNPTNGQKVTVNDKVFVYNSTTSRWTATRLQVLGNLTDDFTIDAPTLGVSLSTVALDTVGANVYITYTVDQDVKATLTTSGLENTTATLHQTNNTIVVTAGATEFSGGQISLVVNNGRSTDTEVINVSATYAAALGWEYAILSLGSSTDTNAYPTPNVVDRSGNDQHVALGGGGTTAVHNIESFNPYNSHSVYFVGTDQKYLTIDATTAVGTADYTLEFFVNPNSISSDVTIFDIRSSGNYGIFSFLSDGQLAIYDGSVTKSTSGIDPITVGKWHHVAFVRESGTLSLYINGQRGHTSSDSFNWTIDSGARIGANKGDVNWFDGFLSNARFTLSAVYSGSSFTVPTSTLTEISNTEFLLFTKGYISDHSSNQYTVDTSDTSSAGKQVVPTVSTFSPIGNKEYTGESSVGSMWVVHQARVSVRSETALDDIGTGDFTIETWVWPKNQQGQRTHGTLRVIDPGVDVTSGGYDFQVWYKNTYQFGGSNYAWNLYFGTGATNTGYVYGPSYKLNQQWFHIAVVRESGVVKFFVNGEQAATTKDYPDDVTGKIIQFQDTDNEPSQFTSDIRISNVARYSSNFSVPDEKLGNDNNTVLYIPYDGDNVYDKSGRAFLWTSDNIRPDNTVTKNAPTSVYFNGSSYIKTADNYGRGTTQKEIYAILGTTPFTIESWIYPTELSGSNFILDFGGVSGSVQGNYTIYTSGTTLRFETSGNVPVATTTIATNTWYHIAMCGDGTHIRAFVDGVQVGSDQTHNAMTAGSSNNLEIGNLAGNYYQGYIEGLQIFRGLAKYTANFTPPTEEQGIFNQG